MALLDSLDFEHFIRQKKEHPIDPNYNMCRMTLFYKNATELNTNQIKNYGISINTKHYTHEVHFCED